MLSKFSSNHENFSTKSASYAYVRNGLMRFSVLLLHQRPSVKWKILSNPNSKFKLENKHLTCTLTGMKPRLPGNSTRSFQKWSPFTSDLLLPAWTYRDPIFLTLFWPFSQKLEILTSFCLLITFFFIFLTRVRYLFELDWKMSFSRRRKKRNCLRRGPS